ncbi:unnamed protein product [Discosporangium mesarthrocarpum]
MITGLHCIRDGPRLHLYPAYFSGATLVTLAFFGRTAQVFWGVSTMVCIFLSLLIRYFLPKILPMGGRGPYSVGATMEYIHTLPEDAGVLGAMGGKEDMDQRPLELMTQIFYPVQKSDVEKTPWFPSNLSHFRSSFIPPWNFLVRAFFPNTQGAFVAASLFLGIVSRRYGAIGLPPFPSALLGHTPEPDTADPRAYAWALVFVASILGWSLWADVVEGKVKRRGFTARYMLREQARRVATFAKTPGWTTEHLSEFEAGAFDGGYMYPTGTPCFPVAPVGPEGDGKRSVIFFLHGLGGNRSIYSEYAVELASQGYICIVPEHNDGTSSSCLFPDGKLTEYIPAPDGNGKTDADRKFRHGQLMRRRREIALLQYHLGLLRRGVPSDLKASKRVGLGDILGTMPPALIGHSFGGATALDLLHQEEIYQEGFATGNGDKGRRARVEWSEMGYSVCIVLDAWTFPLSDAARGHCFKTPLLLVTNDTFLGEEGAVREDRLVAGAAENVSAGASDLVLQIRVQKSRHQNFSDVGVLAPEVLRALKSVGEADGAYINDQVSWIMLCALETFLTPQRNVIVPSSPSPGILELLGENGAVLPSFPEATIRRVSAGGILPPTDYHPDPKLPPS